MKTNKQDLLAYARLEAAITRRSAILIEVEGMKAENQRRHLVDHSPAYDEHLFYEKAVELNGTLEDILETIEELTPNTETKLNEK